MSRVCQQNWASLGRTSIGEPYQGQCLCLALRSSLCSTPRKKNHSLSVPCVSGLPPTVILVDSGFYALLIPESLSNLKSYDIHDFRTDCWQTLGGSAVSAILQCALEFYTRGRGVHRYPAWGDRDKLVHGPKPLKSPKYRCMCMGSIGGATRGPPIARATSPTTPRLSRIIIV